MTGAAAIENRNNFREDLYVLALKAARQIDLARRGKGYDPQDVHAVIDRLRLGADSINSSVERVKNLAPSEIGVMTRALSAFGGAEPKSDEDFAETLERLLGEFSKPLEDLEMDELDHLMVFCVTLHDEMLSQRRTLRESRKLRSRFRV